MVWRVRWVVWKGRRAVAGLQLAGLWRRGHSKGLLEEQVGSKTLSILSFLYIFTLHCQLI